MRVCRMERTAPRDITVSVAIADSRDVNGAKSAAVCTLKTNCMNDAGVVMAGESER